MNCWHSDNWIRIAHLASGTRVNNVGNTNQNVSSHQTTTFHVENEIKGNKTMVDHTTSSNNVNPTDVARNGIQNVSVYRQTIFGQHGSWMTQNEKIQHETVTEIVAQTTPLYNKEFDAIEVVSEVIGRVWTFQFEKGFH